MSSLSDAERDACDLVQTLAGLVSLLGRPAEDGIDPELEDTRRTLLSLARDGNITAVRVLEYLRTLRGAGDGEAVAVPPRLGLWRDWVPPRGNIFGSGAPEPRIGEVHQHRRRSDPGE